MILYLASGNAHKKRELQQIFAGHRLLVPEEAGIGGFDPDENGQNFAENALIKAKALYVLLEGKGPVLADDSGLCVDVLDGRPGILSARYGSRGGKKLDPERRNALLLEEVETALAASAAGAVNSGVRSCRFVCAMVLLFSPERFYLVQETLEGELVPELRAARGKGGFGYDPVVLLPELGKTAAELTEAEKNSLSHRGKAGAALARLLSSAGGVV